MILQGKEGPLQTLAYGILGNVVDAFFIICGFVLFMQVISEEATWAVPGASYRRRFIRIYPAYWLSLVAVLIAMALYLPGPGDLHSCAGSCDLPIHFTALQMPIRLFDGTFQIGLGINGALWMVSVIVCFYFVFPFIARSYYRHPLAGLAIRLADHPRVESWL